MLSKQTQKQLLINHKTKPQTSHQGFPGKGDVWKCMCCVPSIQLCPSHFPCSSSSLNFCTQIPSNENKHFV